MSTIAEPCAGEELRAGTKGDGRTPFASVQTEALPSPRSGRRRFRSAWFPVLLIALTVGSVFTVIRPQYESNDDPGMNMIVAGRGITDQPDEHLIYSNVLIGLVLKQLYMWAPNFPWYGSYLFFAAASALVAICLLLLQYDRTWRNVALVGSLMLILGVPYLAQLQFTRVAFLCTFAGLLLVLNWALRRSAGVQCWIAVPFLLVGSLIRLDANYLAMVIVSPALLLLVWKARTDRRCRHAVCILAGMFVAGIGLDSFNHWYYDRDPAWHGFYEFDTLRAEFIDYSHITYNDETAPILSSVGWCHADFMMLKKWCFLDRERFSLEKLQSIVSTVRERKLAGSPQPISKDWASIAGMTELWANCALGVVLLLILRATREFRFVPLGCYAVALSVYIALYCFRYLPSHVLCPTLSTCVIVTCFFARGPRRFAKTWVWDRSAVGLISVAVLIAGVMVLEGRELWKQDRNYERGHRQTVEMLESLDPQPDELYLAWGSCFPDREAVPPLSGNVVPRDFVGSSRVDLQACKLEYSIVSPK